MGYVHDVSMSQFLGPCISMVSAGTWTDTIAVNVWSRNRTANASSFTMRIPIQIPSNSVASRGAYLKSIDVWYEIATAAATDFATVLLYKITLPVTGTLATAASVAVTLDTGHDTAAERKAVDEHKMTLTLDTPAWIDNDEAYNVEMIVSAAATTVFKFFGSRANYTLRV